jgi:hypothetical protein
MKLKIGIGYSNDQDSFRLGKNVAENALKNGKIDAPTMIITFCGGEVDHDAYFRGLQTLAGEEVPIIGGSAIGIITNEHLSYDGFPAGAAIIESDTLEHIVASVNNLHKNEKLAGQRLAEKLSNTIDGKLLLMFYDSIKKLPTENSPPAINGSPPLIEGIEEKLKLKVPIIGAGLVGDYNFNTTKQFCGSFVETQSVIGSLLAGDFKPYFSIMHGCVPKDGIYHTITRAEGPFLYEVDGKPVIDMIDDQYGSKEWSTQMPVRRLTIGVNHGEKYGEFREDQFVNRLIAGVLPDRKGILLFEPDLAEGSEILFMLRNNKLMMESVQKNTEELFEKIITKGEKPVFGLYIDCAGRTALLSETLTEEASEVQNIFNRYNASLLGFYSGVEVAPLLGRSRGLDWTGVLLVLAENN